LRIHGIGTVVGAIQFDSHGGTSHVALSPGYLCPHLRLKKIGNGNGRQDPNDRDDNQQFNQGETSLFPKSLFHAMKPPWLSSADTIKFHLLKHSTKYFEPADSSCQACFSSLFKNDSPVHLARILQYHDSGSARK
jgi:hypothetical protein